MTFAFGNGRADLTVAEFEQRLALAAIGKNDEDLVALWRDVLSTENVYRELFARQRDNWEIPEVSDDPTVFLVRAFDKSSCSLWVHLDPSLLAHVPRLFADSATKHPANSKATVPTRQEFLVSWDCFTEGLLRHLNWDNVFCAGGAVAGCLTPLPEEVWQHTTPARSRVARRQYFHEKYLPGSDVDLFLYGLTKAQAEAKLQEIFEAAQAANPYEVLIVRSKHAVTLVSQFPFRHVQIVLRLYNSPAEVLMGFDVDACAVGFDGQDVWATPRACLAHVTNTNTVDPVTRRSPSYEMRLAKYAARGFTVLVPELDRSRIDPFLYEKRFDQTSGLARLLLLERLRTPQERLRYRLESQLKLQGHAPHNLERKIAQQMRQRIRQVGSLERAEGGDLTIHTSAELSNYSTVFLPWGKDWTASRIANVIRKKEKILNRVEYTSTGRFVPRKTSYPIHLCAVGHDMDGILHNPFPDDPPLPKNLPPETLETMVYGPVVWLVDNPGRQQIGSFTPIHPAKANEWIEGAYFSRTTERFIMATWRNQEKEIQELLATEERENGADAARALLHSRDYLGRSALHVAVLANAKQALQTLLSHPQATNGFWMARTPDGRLGIHWGCMHNNVDVIKLLLAAREKIIDAAKDKEATKEALDIDSGDWEIKLSPLHYAIVLGHVDVARVLLEAGANARKVSVHKDKGKSESSLSLLAHYASECGIQDWGFAAVSPMAKLLLEYGASPMQVDLQGHTCWHWFAACMKKSSLKALKIVLDLDQEVSGDGSVRALDIMDKQFRTPLYVATSVGNAKAVEFLLTAGALPSINEDLWSARTRQMAADGIQNYVRPFEQMQSFACPIILTVKALDVACLQAFLISCPNLVNEKISSDKRRGGGDKCSILDVVDEFESQMMSQNKGSTKSRIEYEITVADERIRYVQNERMRYEEKSYEWIIWSIQLERENIALDQLNEKLDNLFESEDDIAKEKEGLEQVQKAKAIIEGFGGKRLPANKTMPLAAENTNPQISFQIEPFQFYEPRSLIFEQLAQASRGFMHQSQMNKLTEGESKEVRSLFSALSVSVNEDVDMVLEEARICVSDSSGNTPLFQSLFNSNLVAMENIYFKAIEQFVAFLRKQKERDVNIKKLSEGIHAAETEIALKDQLRRFNNLDIAAGEVPADQGPTRDQLRQRAELSSMAAANQIAEQDNVIFSSVSPEFLLLQRATVLGVYEPKLQSAMEALRSMYPDSFSEDWVSSAIKLRPLELAVIRQDGEAVEKILSLAKAASELFGGATTEENAEAQSGKANEAVVRQTTDEVYGSEDEDYDDEEYDEYNYSNDNGADSPATETTPLSFAELRYFLAGDGSVNESFGGLSLIQLAILMGNSSILLKLLEFAKEYALPLGAVALWKAETDSASANTMDKEALELLNNETKLIAGERLPWWSRTQRVLNHPTLLQFALSVQATSIVSGLINGQYDEAMLGWLTNRDYISSLQAHAQKSHDVMKPSQTAALWLAKVNNSRAQLVRRIIRPTAVDAVGRTALFYCPVDLLSVVSESGIKTLEDCDMARDEASKEFLEVVSTQGNATALAMAVSSNDTALVRALLGAGCCRSTTVGPKHWNALHFAIQAFYDPKCVKFSWATSQTVIETLLEGASEDELREILLSPLTEHNPLMLAASRCASKEVMDLLLHASASCTMDGILRRDAELNTILHIAVKRALVSGSSQDSVEAILEYLQNAELKPLSAEENARGTLPSELALQSILMIWNRARDIYGRTRQFNGDLQQRRKMLGKGQLPRAVVTASAETEDDGSLFHDRVLYKSLKKADDDATFEVVRNPLTLQQVQQAKEHSVQAAKKDVADLVASVGHQGYCNRTYSSSEQSLPSGRPKLFPPSRHGQHRRSVYL